MAQFQHLPIYAACRQLMVECAITVKQFPREYRYTLGQQIQNEVVQMVALIVRANSSRQKRDALRELAERIAVVEALIKLAHDIRILSAKRLATLGPLVDSIGKQIGGWLKRFGGGQPESGSATATQSEHAQLVGIHG